MFSRRKNGNKHGRPDCHRRLCPVDGCTSKVQNKMVKPLWKVPPWKKGRGTTQTNKKYENSSLETSHRQKADDNKTAVTEQKKKNLTEDKLEPVLLLKLLATFTRLTLIPHQKEPQGATQILPSMKTNRSNFQGVVGELRGRELCCTTSTGYRHWRFKTSKVL